VSAVLPLRIDARVRANVRAEGGSGWRLALALARDDARRWSWRAGQFVMLSPGAIADAPRLDPLLPRPMAIYRDVDVDGDGGAAIEILYKVSGRGTQLLSEARPGDRVRLVGPLGTPFAPTAPGQRALLVGGGTGIASLHRLAAESRARGPVVVLLGARRAADLMGRAEFEALGVDLRIATEDGSAGTRGLVTELLESALAETPPPSGDAIYACGPTAMMRRAAAIAAAAGRSCQVSLENRMACGFGVCLGCAVPRADGTIALVCRDGPVFAGDGVAWAGVP